MTRGSQAHWRARAVATVVAGVCCALLWGADALAVTPKGAFATLRPLPRPLMLTAWGLLPDGRVLVAGGFSGGAGTRSAVLFDPRSRRWLATGSLAVGRFAHTLTVLPGGDALVCGGASLSARDPGYLASCERWLRESGTFAPAPALPSPRANHAAVFVPRADGGSAAVVVTGGLGRGSAGLGEVDLLPLGDDGRALAGWRPLAALENGRYHHTATVLRDGRVLVVGGERSDRPIPLFATEIVDPVRATSTVSDPLIEPRVNHFAVALADGRVLVGGGGTFASGFRRSVEIYDPRSQRWRRAAPMHAARGFAQATLLADGRVLVVGGFGNDGDLAEAEIYDPRRNRWALVGERPRPRARGIAVTLADGRVLLAGGQLANGRVLRDAELFDPRATARLADLRLPARVRAGAALAVRYWSGARGPTTIALVRVRKTRGRCPRLTGACEYRRTATRRKLQDKVGWRRLRLATRTLPAGRYEIVVRHAGRELRGRFAVVR